VDSIPADYHVHSLYSVDATSTPAEIVKAAEARGIAEIAFTEHADFEYDDPGYGFYDHDAHTDALARIETDVRVRKGVEIDYQKKFQNDVTAFLKDKRFDFVLGAVHFINGRSFTAPDFFHGFEEEELFSVFFDRTRELVEAGIIDVLAHLDILRRYSVSVYGPTDFTTYRDRYEEICRALIERGVALEVNTSGLRQEVADTFPTLDAVKLYWELGGRLITVGSDAHRAEDIGKGIGETVTKLKGIGFTELTTFAGGDVGALKL